MVDMHDEHKVQVTKGYYSKNSYNTLERFISYYHQINFVLETGAQKILEIGPGSNIVTHYLRETGHEVSTCDFDKNVKPDIVADVRSIPVPDKSYDAVLAFQILEHIPFEDLGKALKEFSRISRRSVIISVPYRSTVFEWVLKFPGIRTLFKKTHLDLSVRLPLTFKGFETSGQHYWEIDRKKYTLAVVREELKKYFVIKQECSPVLNKFHYFFILELA